MGKSQKPITPPPDPPEPEHPKVWGEFMDGLLAEVASRFPNVERRDGRLADEPALLVDPLGLVDLASFLRDNDLVPMNHCRCVTGTDKVDRFEVVYSLAHLPAPGVGGPLIFEKVSVVVVIDDRSRPQTPSLCKLWPAADFQEREIYDLLGIEFEGHPDLRRILLSDEFKGHPLRRDYPLIGRWDDMTAVDAHLDENQVRAMKEAAGKKFDPLKDVPPSYKR